MRKKRNQKKGSNRGAILIITGIVATLLIGMTIQIRQMEQKNNAYKEQQAVLEQQIAEEDERTTEIADLEEYMQSQEYIEQVAKDKLGLVYEDEIIFKPES